MANEVTWTTYKGDLSWDYWILADEIIRAAMEQTRLRNYVKVRSIAGDPSNAALFPTTPAVSASALTDGTDITANTAFSPSNATLTVGESGLKFTYTDLASGGSITDMSELAFEGGRAIVDKENDDIAALFDGFSTTVGSTTVDLTEATVLDAIATLRGAKEYGPFTMVLHTDSYYKELVADIGTTISALGNTGGSVRSESNDLMRRGDNVGPLFGVENVVLTTSVPEDGNSDKTNAIFSNRAIGLVDKWTVRPEMERDASLRGTEVVVTSAYAVGELLDTAGVQIISDGA